MAGAAALVSTSPLLPPVISSITALISAPFWCSTSERLWFDCHPTIEVIKISFWYDLNNFTSKCIRETLDDKGNVQITTFLSLDY